MASTLGTPGVLRAGMFRINEEMIAALETANELPSLEIHLLWAKCSLCQHNFQDPDSRRAENFWWHVWGSNRKNLPPRTLAKVLNEIRDGPTVVPPPKPSLLQGAKDERREVTGATTGEEHISPLLSPKISSLGSFSFATSCSSSPSAIVAAHGLGTSDKGKRPARVSNSLSPSAERPSPQQSLLKKMADAHAPASYRHNLPAFSFSPNQLPENVIFEDVSPLEPPRSLIVQAPNFGLDTSWCAREVPGEKREHPRAIVPLDARFQPAGLRAAPSDPGPATSNAITDPRHTSSADNAGPLVRVVGFGPFLKPLGHEESDSQPPRGTHIAAHKHASSRRPFRTHMASCKEEPRPLAGPTGAGWEALSRPAPLPVAAKSATLATPRNSPVKWSNAASDDTETKGSSASDFITLPADLARPPIPETYKRPKAATLDTPMFGLRPFYLPSTIESRRATTIARREVERQFPPLQLQPLAAGPRQRADRPRAHAEDPPEAAGRRRADAAVAAHDRIYMKRGAGTGRVYALDSSRAARKISRIDEVLRGEPARGAKPPAAPTGGWSEPNGGTIQPGANANSTSTATTASQHRAEPSSPLGKGPEALYRSAGDEPATLTHRVATSRPSASVTERSKESLRRPGSSSSHLSFLLNQENGRAGR
ncbi:hypothetical protein RB595_010156 [Gaeumannomyces hyphopodioides]